MDDGIGKSSEAGWTESAWCEQYRKLTAYAQRSTSDLLDRFEAAMADVRAGVSPAEATATHGIATVMFVSESVDRGVETGIVAEDLSTTSLSAFGISDFPVDGEYRCPRAPQCGRRALTDPRTGYEPECAIADRVMERRPRQ